MTDYVLGFLFDGNFANVALIQKGKPEWQKGKLNGIGGKVETSDRSLPHAMDREFEEEAGVVFGATQSFCTITGADYSVSCFVSANTGRLLNVRSCTKERVSVFDVSDILCSSTNIIPNLKWLIPMAIEYKRGRDGFYHAEIKYSPHDVRSAVPENVA